ncbi:hypothetical protein [Undibacterium sp. TJN19]|uniref:hypothetical protein n=1 Tax=Undibacterium sp. TJN19 TaxID=3413055 RepID=UPI003BF00FDE
MASATNKKVSPVVASTVKKAVAVKKPVAAVKKAVVAKVAPAAKAAPAIKTAVRAKAVAKPAGKAAAKPVTKPVDTKLAISTTKIIIEPVEKVKKAKLVRDSFTMPEIEYAALGAVKKACLKAGIEVKKSQLLRIGVALLGKTDVPSLKKMIAELAPLKAGRPKKEK